MEMGAAVATGFPSTYRNAILVHWSSFTAFNPGPMLQQQLNLEPLPVRLLRRHDTRVPIPETFTPSEVKIIEMLAAHETAHQQFHGVWWAVVTGVGMWVGR
jgi:hypothetical protein